MIKDCKNCGCPIAAHGNKRYCDACKVIKPPRPKRTKGCKHCGIEITAVGNRGYCPECRANVCIGHAKDDPTVLESTPTNGVCVSGAEWFPSGVPPQRMAYHVARGVAYGKCLCGCGKTTKKRPTGEPLLFAPKHSKKQFYEIEGKLVLSKELAALVGIDYRAFKQRRHAGWKLTHFLSGVSPSEEKKKINRPPQPMGFLWCSGAPGSDGHWQEPQWFHKTTNKRKKQTCCIVCRREHARLRRSEPCGRAKLLVDGARRRARKAGIEFDLSYEWATSCIENPCPVTGRQFDLISLREEPGLPPVNVPSIDRIDPSGDYTMENCRIVVDAYNRMKAKMPEKEVMALISDITT